MEEGKNSLKIHIVAHEFILRLFLIARYYSINNNRNQLLPTFLTPLSTPSVPCVFSTVHVLSHVFEEDIHTTKHTYYHHKWQKRVSEVFWMRMEQNLSPFHPTTYNFLCYCGQVTSKHQKLSLSFFTQFTYNFDNNLRLTTTTSFFLSLLLL